MTTEAVIALCSLGASIIFPAFGVAVQYGMSKKFMEMAEGKFKTLEDKQSEHTEKIAHIQGQLDPLGFMRTAR